MDFKNIPVSHQPAYTWLWNTTVTKEGIKERIDEMLDSGIRAFYVLGEPENFRPGVRNTHLSPEYLSEEYIDLVYYAYEYAKSRGMYTWLYNEGGFPSGMACGQVTRDHPELAIISIASRKVTVKSGEAFIPAGEHIAAYIDGKRIKADENFAKDTEITEYYFKNADNRGIRTDIANKETVKHFLNLTHEKLKKRFGDAMGSDVIYMFDDESFMGTWTRGMEDIFIKKYGYDIRDFLPIISGERAPKTREEYKASSDFIMLAGDLVRDNYFIPMRKWLNDHGMKSTGHIDNDHIPEGIYVNRYGNSMKTLREFDVPGIDVIYGQLSYPEKLSPETMRFFPRFASSAARQMGHSDCLSESFAVYGAMVDPEEMRYGVNCQAVRGISLFNFMVMSYDRKTAMMHQYRPNFIKENPSLNRLSEINNHTARLSYILSNSRADIKTALYHPARTICASGEIGKAAGESFRTLGHKLEEAGVSFDIIDEEIVENASLDNGALVIGDIKYENIFTPNCDLEKGEVIEKLRKTNGEISPVIQRTNTAILSRKLLFDNGDIGYFIVNTSGENVCEKIKISTPLTPYEIDLSDGEIYTVEYEREGDLVSLITELKRGEGVMLLFSENEKNAFTRKKKEKIFEIEEISSFISKRMHITHERGTYIETVSHSEIRSGFYPFEKDFSGEVTYIARLPELCAGEYEIDLGALSSTAEVFIDGRSIGITTYPPYSIKFRVLNQSRELKIIIANTAANECVSTDFFALENKGDVGGYHEKMNPKEALYRGGGLFGPITIYKLI